MISKLDLELKCKGHSRNQKIMIGHSRNQKIMIWGRKNMQPKKISAGGPLVIGMKLNLTSVKQYVDPHPMVGGQHYNQFYLVKSFRYYMELMQNNTQIYPSR